MADREPYPYFEQQEHVPQNRLECDTFNKFHFDRLRAIRGKEYLTPKVGEEPLTLYEVEYVRQVNQNRSPSHLVRSCRSLSLHMFQRRGTADALALIRSLYFGMPFC
jgi:hypothetical protein